MTSHKISGGETLGAGRGRREEGGPIFRNPGFPYVYTRRYGVRPTYVKVLRVNFTGVQTSRLRDRTYVPGSVLHRFVVHQSPLNLSRTFTPDQVSYLRPVWGYVTSWSPNTMFFCHCPTTGIGREWILGWKLDVLSRYSICHRGVVYLCVFSPTCNAGFSRSTVHRLGNIDLHRTDYGSSPTRGYFRQESSGERRGGE